MTDIQKWADDAMYEAEPMERNTPHSRIISATPDPLGAIAAACMIYEGKVCRDIKTDVNDEMRKYYWEQVQQTHLTAPLEFVDLHIVTEGVTRAFTHQMVRQRTAVYAQESMRFAVKENLADETQLPPSLAGTLSGKEKAEAVLPYDIDSPEQSARETWDAGMEMIEEVYNRLINLGMPAEDARGILPHATTTRIHYKTNLRNLVEHAGNRLCTQAQFEWRLFWSDLLYKMRNINEVAQSETWSEDNGTFREGLLHASEESNWQWAHIADSNLFKPVCFAKGKCPFKADFDRGCTIRERADAGRFDEIKTEEWALDPTAARRRKNA